MKLFLSVVCVMAVIAVNGSDLTDSGLQKEEKNHQPQIFREIISLDQNFDAQSRKAACSDKGGRCIKNKRDCPNNLPLTKFGKTFCRKGRKCCVPDTICNRLCEEDRSGSPPPATVCWGSPDGKDTASFPGPCWAERAAECDPNYANWIYKFDGPCFCQLQKVMDKCKDEVAETARYYYNWDEKRCVEFAFDHGCSTNANNFVSSEDCFNTCAAFSPPSENWQLIRNACIKWNKYKTLNDSSIENCEKICEEDEKNGIACKSVTYHISTRLCRFSELGSTSDAYTQPCYLEGFDLYEYTKIVPQTGCHNGTFSIPPSNKCFKLTQEPMEWSGGWAQCAAEGMVFAQPADDIAIELRQYLINTYGQQYIWVSGRGDGEDQTWMRDATAIQPALLWPGVEKESGTDWCLSIYAFQSGVEQLPDQPYTRYWCHDEKWSARRVLCEAV